MLQSYFDFQEDRLPDEYRAVCATVDRLTVDRYRDYKLKTHNHLKAHGPSCPYGEIYAEDWQKCIDFFTSPTFDKIVELRKTKQTQVASSGASLDECAIIKEVLRERRRHVRGVRHVPKLDLTDASKAPQGTSHQFFGDPQKDDLRFAIYEVQLRRMEQEIQLLKNSILEVVPEED
ncbi:hypothetical protein Adt_31034 [Abeliophyllum distichum]|uniref:Uncharacterized protein n=1 Tax=Abeliophyllum distichum TaxID=126358 RepID=A0ABD1REQ2_9LAMI